DASEKEFIDRLKKADVVFFTGGSQIRLTALIGGSPFIDLIKQKLKKEDFIYAGTSAGAAAASDAMIYQGKPEKALLKGEIQISHGFGLVQDVVFDTHFINRGRIGRLFQIVTSNPSVLGIGLEENSALLISGSRLESIGPGMTIVVDGHNIKNSNLLEIKEGVPLSIDGLSLHVMSKTDVFDLMTRRLTILTPEDCKI
ncbi:MAG TPA: cyanophycinase, partial [Flavobacterium sp.]